jgi:arylsulfatase A-like enzyme
LWLTGCGGCDSPCNILLISIDSQRADMLSCYGYRSATGAATSPNLDALAADGLLFEQALSTTSWTMPAHHALFSGLPDILHGAFDDLHGPTPDRLILAQSLRDAGYATAGFYSGPYLHPAYGFAAGFDTYHNASMLPMPADFKPEERDFGYLERVFHSDSSAEEVTYRGQAFLRRHVEDHPEQPFFLFLHYFDVHYDYHPPKESYASRFWPAGTRPRIGGDYFIENDQIHADMEAADLQGVITYYNGETYWVDRQIGLVLAELDKLGLSQQTLVVVTADHGDEFFEHGNKGHRRNLYQESTRVPLLLKLPSRWSGGQRITQRVSLVDLAPTLLDLAGVSASGPQSGKGLKNGMWGRSLRPLIEGKESDSREVVGYLFNSLDPDRPTNYWALWTGPHKVVARRVFQPGRREILSTAFEIYDLQADPGEARNLFPPSSPATRQALLRYEAVYCDQLYPLTEEFSAGPIPSFNEAEALHHQEVLESLGYLAPTSVSQQPPPPRLPKGP